MMISTLPRVAWMRTVSLAQPAICHSLFLALLLAPMPALSSEALAKRYACQSCHHDTKRVIGPSWASISKKYRNNFATRSMLKRKIREGSRGTWGEIPMPPHATIPDSELNTLLAWVLTRTTPYDTAHDPGFSCGLASGKVEQTLCADAELAKLDQAMSRVYADRLKLEVDPKTLRDSQRAWISTERESCGMDRACLEKVYKSRIETLRTSPLVSTDRKTDPDTSVFRAMPFQPGLILNADDGICAPLLSKITRVFKSTARSSSLLPEGAGRYEIVTDNGWRWLAWKPMEFPKDIDLDDPIPSATLYEIEISDPRHGGHAKLVKRSMSHSWRGDIHAAAYFESGEALRQAMQRIARKGVLTTDDVLSSGRRFYPDTQAKSAEAHLDIGLSEWIDPSIATYKGRYFFLSRPTLFEEAQPVTLFEIVPGGETKPICAARVRPEQSTVTAFLTQPGLRTLFQRLRAIGAGGDGWCGTLGANHGHDQGSAYAIERLGFQPWNVDQTFDVYYKWDARTARFLDDWANDWDAWSQRERRVLEDEIASARLALQRYFVREYDLTEAVAQNLAGKSLEYALGAAFQVPSAYTPHTDMNPGEIAKLDQYGQLDAISRQLRRMLASGAANEKIELFIKQVTTKANAHDLALAMRSHQASAAAAPAAPAGTTMAAVAPSQRQPDRPTGPIQAFFLSGKEINEILKTSWQVAVAHAHSVELLLKHGLDVNVTNDFGKTMLMYAAQLNRPDIVRLLLKHGARVGLKTRQASDCGMVVEGGRDALSYAAENAGTEVMRLLVEAGAETADLDKLRERFAANPYLSEAAKKLSLKQLITTRLPIESDMPSYPCTGKLSSLDKLVCQRPSLARRDQEINFAFQAWRDNAAGPETDQEKIDSQREWLKQRATACGRIFHEDEQNGCVQLWTASRIRYLFGRAGDH